MPDFSKLQGVSSAALGELASFFGIAVATLDQRGNAVGLNTHWLTWNGRISRLGAGWLADVDPSDRSRVEAALQEATIIEPVALECGFLRPDGSPTWVLLRIFRMTSESGELEGFVVAASDISRLHAMIKKVESTALSTIESLSTMEAVRDLYTAGHQKRVGGLAEQIGRELGFDQSRLTGLRIGALLHDVGKVGTPIEILTKPARLTAAEYDVMKEHTANGYAILKNVESDWPVARVAHEHHERMDGSGYPQGLHGDSILLEARITAVADVVESMAIDRPYRSALGLDRALEEIEANKGRLYDPGAASACVAVVEAGWFATAAARV